MAGSMEGLIKDVDEIIAQLKADIKVEQDTRDACLRDQEPAETSVKSGNTKLEHLALQETTLLQTRDDYQREKDELQADTVEIGMPEPMPDP